MSERINVLITAYNTAEFVEAALESIYDFADEISVLEGAWAAGAPAHSIDGTWEKILAFPDPKKKIIINHHSRFPNPESYPFVSKQHEECVLNSVHSNPYYNGDALQQQLIARDFAFRQFTNPTGWLMFVDSDEIWTKSDLEGIQAAIDSMGSFYNSFTFLAKNFYFGYKYYAEEFYQRLIRIPPKEDCPYMRRTCCLGWESFDPSSGVENVDIPESLSSFFHYGYVGFDRVKRKLSMWHQPTVRKWFEKHADLWAGAEYDGRSVHLLEEINPVYKNYTLKKFEGSHPDPIQRRLDENNGRNTLL